MSIGKQAAAAFCAALAGGCASLEDRFGSPQFSSQVIRPQASHTAEIEEPQPQTSGSLWRSGPESLFGDRRARKFGDILTIVVEIDDQAEIRNRSERRRDASEALSAPEFLGLDTLARRVLPSGAGLDPAIDASAESRTNGEGSIRRRERVTLRVAATVTDVLSNGNLVIEASQEVRVNDELRDLRVTGIVRREDISRSNVVAYDKIAEARIFYGGRGDIARANRVRFGQKLVDMVSPF